MRGFLDHAVPKKKTSHSKKAMRSANKGLKEQTGAFFAPLFSSLEQRADRDILTLSYHDVSRMRRSEADAPHLPQLLV